MVESVTLITLTATVLANGPDFAPQRAEEVGGFEFTSRTDRGSRMERGRYKGLPAPYGAGNFALPNFSAASPKPLELSQLEKVVRHSRSAGATSIVLQLEVAFVAQCNFEVSPELLAALGELSVPLTITCFEQE